MVYKSIFQWGLNTLEAWIHQKKTKLDMLASQVCMLEVGSICMSFFLVLHIVFGVLLAGEMHSQHMMYNNQNIYALIFFLSLILLFGQHPSCLGTPIWIYQVVFSS